MAPRRRFAAALERGEMSQSDDDRALRGALADAEASMHKGRAGSLVLIACLGLALVGGLVFMVGGEDKARVYGEIGKRVNGLAHASFDQFWACALQGENVTDIKSNAELATQLGGRAQERGRAYGVHVREKCMPKLEDIGPQLDTLIVPQDLQTDVGALKQANAALRTSFSGLIAYLDNPDLQYDETEAKHLLDPITRAWYDFKKASASINKIIKGKLESS
jgi:hypothetical protein